MYKMLCSDANKRLADMDENIDSITVDVACGVERELQDSPYDVISLVFLLYDVPDTALQRLIVYERVSKDVYSTNLNLIHEWIQVAKARATWRHEFLEALLICQLYGIVRKLGFNVSIIKRQYQPDNIFVNMYVNPTKKALYKLCENINSDNLNMLKRTLLTYQIDTMEYDSCELIFLKLMSEKIIPLNQFKAKNLQGFEFNFEKLVKIIQKLPGLENYADQLRMLQNRNDGEASVRRPEVESSPIIGAGSSDFSTAQPVTPQPVKQKYEDEQFHELYELLGDLNIEDNMHIKSDSKRLGKDNYTIKSPKRIGVCLIINQEDFHLCEQSIHDESLKTALGKRKGSSLDKKVLEKTMSELNFEVITADNLNHKDMLSFIRDKIKHNFRNTDSIFMLCIMSHGVRDHVFAADGVKVKVEDIENLLDSDMCNLRGIPKVMIIQACQVDDVPQQTTLVADSPNHIYYMRKMDFLVYWATSPEFEAFRDEEAGTIFIQILCAYLKKNGKNLHLYDIFTKVNYAVTRICTIKKCPQVPIFKTTLVNNLFLHIPE